MKSLDVKVAAIIKSSIDEGWKGQTIESMTPRGIE